MFRILICLMLISWSAEVAAKPTRYILEADKSRVAFTYSLNGQLMKGNMPVADAELRLDFDRVANSSVSVSLDAARARAGIVFATEAMRGPSVLNVAAHPLISFESNAISGSVAKGAQIDGLVTLRGVTRPARFTAQIYRQKGSPEGDLSQLSVLLSGAVNRSEFGATGFSKEVGDQIGIEVLARIRRVE